MFALGIDPGLSRCGYGAVDARGREGKAGKSGKAVAVAVGVITTSPQKPLPLRLTELQRELRLLISELRPDVVVIERVFFQVNVRTAMSVAQASGIAMLAACSAGCAA